MLKSQLCSRQFRVILLFSTACRLRPSKCFAKWVPSWSNALWMDMRTHPAPRWHGLVMGDPDLLGRKHVSVQAWSLQIRICRCRWCEIADSKWQRIAAHLLMWFASNMRIGKIGDVACWVSQLNLSKDVQTIFLETEKEFVSIWFLWQQTILQARDQVGIVSLTLWVCHCSLCELRVACSDGWLGCLEASTLQLWI